MGAKAYFDRKALRDQPDYAEVELPQIIVDDIRKSARKAATGHAVAELLNPFHLIPIAMAVNSIRKGIQQGDGVDQHTLEHVAIETSVALGLTAASFWLTNDEHRHKETRIYQQEFNRSDKEAKSFKDLPDFLKDYVTDGTLNTASIGCIVGGVVTALARAKTIHYPGEEQVKSLIEAVDSHLPKVLGHRASPFAAAAGAAALTAVVMRPYFEKRAVKETNEVHEKISHAKQVLSERDIEHGEQASSQQRV